MKNESTRPEKPIANQIAEQHHRPIVVCGAAEIAHVGPDGGGKNFVKVMSIPEVGVVHDLKGIVINVARRARAWIETSGRFVNSQGVVVARRARAGIETE